MVDSRRKGAQGERELAALFRERGYEALRGQQRSGLEQADVVGGPPNWHVEAKRVQALNFWQAFAQADRDRAPGELPVVCARRDRGEWLALMRMSDWLDLLARVESLQGLVDELHRAPVSGE